MLFGEFSPEGKLPVTFYQSSEELPDFTDYNMAGRTYRYMKNEALYPFGYGLSYTKFELSNIAVDAEELIPGKDIHCSVDIKNTGAIAGAETIQVYVKAKVEGAPNHQLKGLKKVQLNPGEQKTITITLKDEAFGLYDNNGELVLHDAEFELFIGTSQPDARSIKLTGEKPYSKIIRSKSTVIL
jgi:beta-glucosidase